MQVGLMRHPLVPTADVSCNTAGAETLATEAQQPSLLVPHATQANILGKRRVPGCCREVPASASGADPSGCLWGKHNGVLRRVPPPRLGTEGVERLM